MCVMAKLLRGRTSWGQAGGLLGAPDQKMPRRCERASVREQYRRIGRRRGEGSMSRGKHKGQQGRELPDHFPTVAAHVLRYCEPRQGIWMDLGCGAGGLGLELARVSRSTVLLLDPDVAALRRAVGEARAAGLHQRMFPVVAQAEHLPLVDDSVELVVSRGSIFFWEQPPQGLREVQRVLRPGGKAMIGGGVGETYPEWAREEWTRWRWNGLRAEGAEAVAHFEHVTSPDTHRQWAQQGGLRDFEVAREKQSPGKDANPRLGIWLRFRKRCR